MPRTPAKKLLIELRMRPVSIEATPCLIHRCGPTNCSASISNASMECNLAHLSEISNRRRDTDESEQETTPVPPGKNSYLRFGKRKHLESWPLAHHGRQRSLYSKADGMFIHAYLT